ncbi:MAG: hypothetical protein ABL973_09620 [Micropepsaceae bacterium]
MTPEEILADKKVNPSSSYLRPDDIVNDAALTNEQKIAILREWHYDALRLQDAAQENMAGGEPDRLQAVSNALLKLGVAASEDSKPSDAGAPRESSQGQVTGH